MDGRRLLILAQKLVEGVAAGTPLTAGDGAPECRTAISVWEGLVKDNVVDAQLRRRNLGTLHFVDGRPVDGSRYARAVVAMTTGKPPTPFHAKLYEMVQSQISQRDGNLNLTEQSKSAHLIVIFDLCIPCRHLTLLVLDFGFISALCP